MKKFRHLISIFTLCLVAVFCVSACGNSSEWFGDTLGGGEEMSGEVPEESSDNYSDEIDNSISEISEITMSTSSVPDGATQITVGTTISGDGNYYISGSLSLGSNEQISIASSNLNVVLYLDNATITSAYSTTSDEGAILVKKSSSVVIVLVDGTENSITTTYSSYDSTTETTTGMEAICANKSSELSIVGNGSLTINSTGPSIKSKNNLYVQDATIVATSQYDNCIKATNTLTLNNCNISATAKEDYGCALKANAIMINSSTVSATANDKDAIHAENSDYDTATSAPTFSSASDFYANGYIYCKDSNITVTTTGEGDGMQADTFVKIDGGTIDITTNGGAPSNITENSSDNASGKGIKVGLINYGEDYYNDGEGIDLESEYYCIYIEDGTITVNSNDDAVHSNGDLYISGGTLNIKSGDDGIHADNFLQISGSPTIDISKSYEGIEAAQIEISGGTISVSAVDDGINAADGESNSSCYILISGGTISVDAKGDGVDSNGTILISGGAIYVNGPASRSADAALDSDGGILVTGGELFAVGSKQMVETPSTSSTQCVVSYSSSSTITAGTTLALKDSSGNTIISLTTTRTCQSIVLSSASLSSGSSYTLYSGSTALSTFKISKVITSIGSEGTNKGFGGTPNMGR